LCFRRGFSTFFLLIYKKKLKGVNQQETLLSNLLGFPIHPRKGLEGYNTSYSNSKGSSETTCDITYNFEEYSNLIPQQKKKINKNFLE